MKKKSIVLTKDKIVSILAIAIAILNFAALAFALVDAEQKFISYTDSFFANGFTLIFGECPIVIESYGTLLSFYSVCHFIAAIVIVALLSVRLAVTKRLNFGKMGMVSVIISAIFTTLYFVMGCIAFSEATAYGGIGYGYDANTFAFIPFVFMLILVASFILVKVKLPKNYKLEMKK